MSYAAAVNSIRSWFKTKVVDALSVKAVLDNEQPSADKISNTEIWLKLSVIPAQSLLVEYGATRRYRYPGLVQVTVHAPLGVGDGTAFTTADSIAAAFRSKTADSVRFRVPYIDNLGVQGTSFVLVVSVPYYFDDIGSSEESMSVSTDILVTPYGVFEAAETVQDALETISDLLTGTSLITKLRVSKTVTFEQELNNGNSGTAKTIDWSQAQKQSVTLTANCTLTFANPDGPCHIQLKLVQDATGSRTVSWPSNIKWVGASAPLLTIDAAAIDIVTLYFDGANFFGAQAANFG